MIVSRVPAVAFCLQPTELQTDSRKWISRVSNSHRLLHRTTIIIGSVGFFSLLLLVLRLGVLRIEEGSPIPQGNEIQTVLFKREELSERNKKRSWEAPFF